MDFLRSTDRNYLSYEPQPVDEVSLTIDENRPAQKFIKGCSMLLFSPIWISFSLLVEIVCIPFHMTYNVLRRCQDKRCLFALSILFSPLLILLFLIGGILFAPVSLVFKIYEFLLTDDLTEAYKSLIYPDFHPVYDDYLKPAKKARKAKIGQSFAGFKTATASYAPPNAFEPEGLVIWKVDEENGQKH